MHTSKRHSEKGRQVGGLHPVWLVGLAVLLLPAVVWPQQGNEPVSLYLNVENDNSFVEGLTAEDFRLYQDGKSREFKLEIPESPATVAVLLEFSQSSLAYANDIEYAMQGFLDNAPDGNWYALATFSHDMTVQVDFTRKIGRIKDAFDDLMQPEWDEIDTYDAVYDMLDKMARMPGRRVLVLIGSGFDTFSRHSLKDVQKKVEGTNVTIYCPSLASSYRGIYQPYLGNSADMDLLEARNFLQTLADYSGGQAWFPDLAGSYYDVMKVLFQDLKYQYRLVYTPDVPADGKTHSIKVEAFRVVNDQRKDFQVRVRKNWRIQ